MHLDPTGLVVRRNVQGAPLTIDARVQIVPSLDSSADSRFEGRAGVVSGYFYDCPQEQYPHRPLVLVCVKELGEELFFAEELRAVRAVTTIEVTPRR